MELLIALIGIGVTIIMVLILLSGFMQDMNWYDNKASFDVVKANREDAEVSAAPRKQKKQKRKSIIEWMNYHEINQ